MGKVKLQRFVDLQKFNDTWHDLVHGDDATGHHDLEVMERAVCALRDALFNTKTLDAHLKLTSFGKRLKSV